MRAPPATWGGKKGDVRCKKKKDVRNAKGVSCGDFRALCQAGRLLKCHEEMVVMSGPICAGRCPLVGDLPAGAGVAMSVLGTRTPLWMGELWAEHPVLLAVLVFCTLTCALATTFVK